MPILPFLAFVGFSVLAFSRNYGHLAIGVDGVLPFEQAIHAWKWAPLGLGFGSDPFQGMGDLWGLENVLLTPAHLLYAVIFGIPDAFTAGYAIVAYTIVACELFLSVLIFARSIGIGTLTATLSAWLLALLALPYFGPSRIYPIFQSAPTGAATIAEATFLLAAIACLGRTFDKSRKRLPWPEAYLVITIVLLMVWLVAAHPADVMLWAPSAAVVTLGLVLGAPRRETLQKSALLAGCSLFVLLAGAGLFLFGIFDFTTPRFWAGMLENTILDPTAVSIWYGHPDIGADGPRFFAFGVFGMATAIVYGDRRLRACAATLLPFVAMILLSGQIVLRWQNWRGPQPVYFEFMIWPFYAIFGVWAAAFWIARIFALAEWLVARHRRCAMKAATAFTIGLAAVNFAVPIFAFTAAFSEYDNNRTYSFPPTSTPLIRYLHDHVGLNPGGPYRGRIVTMEYVGNKEPIGWADIAAKKIASRYAATGNDYFTVGLWYYDIPTLFEYNVAMSPAFFRAVTSLLAQPEDAQMRNVITLRHADPHAMALLGVRFVITDGQLPEPFRLVMNERTYGNEVLSLYEVPRVNLGKIAPTEVTVAANFSDALKELKKPTFDFNKSVVVFDPALAQRPLTPVAQAQIRMVRGGFRVEAQSAGLSLLVVPFEFSRCLEVFAGSGDLPHARLIRVNAIETGILFDQRISAEIRYFTGLLNNRACRVQDSSDLWQLLTAPVSSSFQPVG